MGAWDVVVPGNGESPETRLEDGIKVVPAQVRIGSVTPAKLTAFGPQTLKITFTGPVLTQSLPLVRFSKGQDTLLIDSIWIQNEATLSMNIIVTGKTPQGNWNLNVTLPSRKVSSPEAVEVAPVPVSMTVNALDSIEQDTYIRLDLKGLNTFYSGGPDVWLKNGQDSIPSITNPEYISRYYFGFDYYPSSAPANTNIILFNIPAEAKLGYWDLHVRRPWYSLSQP